MDLYIRRQWQVSEETPPQLAGLARHNCTWWGGLAGLWWYRPGQDLYWVMENSNFCMPGEFSHSSI